MDKDIARKYIPLIALAILLIISFLMVRSYIVALISAFILAYLFHPWTKWLENKMSKPLAAIVTIIIALLIILVPLGGVIFELSAQTYKAIQHGAIDKTFNFLSNIDIVEKYNIDISSIGKKALEFGLNYLDNFTISVASVVLGIFIMVFAMYFMLTEWSTVGSRIKRYIPFTNKDRLVSDVGEATKKIIHGTLLIAIIEFVVAAIGFWLAGSEFFLVLATTTALLAFIPGGPALVWVPTMIVELLSKNYTGSGIILIFGLFISIYIDTIFRAKVAGKDARIHPLIALIGILGGTTIFGIPGIVIGPLFLSYTLKILEEVISD